MSSVEGDVPAENADANSAFQSEDQPWSCTMTPVNEKPIIFRIYRGEPICFDLTYKDKDELYEALKRKLAEIGATEGKPYCIRYPFDYSLIENADDLISAILPDRPLKLFTTAAEGDDTSTSSSSSESASEDDISVGRRHCHHKRSFHSGHGGHLSGHHQFSPWASYFLPNPCFSYSDCCHHRRPPCRMGYEGCCHY